MFCLFVFTELLGVVIQLRFVDMVTVKFITYSIMKFTLALFIISPTAEICGASNLLRYIYWYSKALSNGRLVAGTQVRSTCSSLWVKFVVSLYQHQHDSLADGGCTVANRYRWNFFKITCIYNVCKKKLSTEGALSSSPQMG